MIFLDANILMEIIEERKRLAACVNFLDSHEELKGISTLSLDLAMYLTERSKLDPDPIQIFLESFTWLPVTDTDAHWAFAHFKGRDFEDGLQVACALREKCSKFVTLDHGLAKKYADQLPVELIR